MSQPRILFSRDAERDLDALADWIALDSGVARAEAILRRLQQTFRTLAELPRIGRVRHDLDGSRRSFAVWPWVIFYEPLPDDDGVLILRVVDGRRDLTSEI